MFRRPNDRLVEPSATTALLSLSDRTLLLATVVSPFLSLWFRSRYLWLGLIPLSALILYFWQRDFTLFAHAVFWPIFFVGLLCLRWPLNFIVPLGVYIALYAGWPRLRNFTIWLVSGRFTSITVKWMVPTILMSSGGLLAWVFLFHPDLSGLTRMVPQGRPVLPLQPERFSQCSTRCGKRSSSRVLLGSRWNKCFSAAGRSIWRKRGSSARCTLAASREGGLVS